MSESVIIISHMLARQGEMVLEQARPGAAGIVRKGKRGPGHPVEGID
jgi:hypothetical protein